MAMRFGPLLQLHAIFLLVFLAFHASSCEQEDYWQMKLPKVPMPQAITDNLFHPKDQMSVMTPSIETKEKAAQGNDADKAKKANMNQPFTVMAWKYNDDNAKEKVGIDQSYTVMGGKYNVDSAKEKVGIDQPYTVMGWKYNADRAKEKVNIDQPYTVMGWKYNADSAKKKIGINQPYTVMGWKYNADSAKEKVGIDQPYTVMGWKYNADSAKEKVGIDQPYTVMGWKYNADSAKEKVDIDQPYTVMGWKYKAGDAKKRVGLDQPYTVMAWKYNEENGNKEKVNEVSSGSVFFVEKSLRLGEKLKHDFQKTPSVPFLPKHIAESIPFSGDKFTEILDLFSIKPGSVEATGIKGTLDICLHRPKVEKENRTCAQSMEDIVDFVVRELGSNDLELRMMRSDIEVPKGIQDYVLTKVKKLVVPGNTAAACHRMSYPYVVYYCHHQQDIGHYDVTLVSPTSGNTFQTTAVCHYDTYAWKPNVPALQYLGIRPGDAPVCHFSAINDMFWSLKADSKSLDMVV